MLLCWILEGNCNTMVSITVSYYNIRILRGQRRIRGLSLTETSFCGAWLHSFFWVTPRRLNFVCQLFGFFGPNIICINTLAISSQLFFSFKRPMKMEQKECSETSAQNIQAPWNHSNKKYNIHNTAKVCNQKQRILLPQIKNDIEIMVALFNR